MLNLFEDSLSLKPLHEWFTIPSPGENIWQVGKTYKHFLDSSLSGNPVLITDTIYSYPDNIDDYFLLSIPSVDSSWAEGILSFYHRYHTDTLEDGGIIEVSYDKGQTWKNVVFDKNHILTNFIGLYPESDTIIGNHPAFTGSSKEWIYIELHWVWIALVKKTEHEQSGRPIIKFRFKADSSDNEKDGWLIDHLIFRGYSVIGAVEDRCKSTVSVFPNPVTDFLNVYIPKNNGKIVLAIYSLDGKLKFMKEINELEILDISDYFQGIYYFIVFEDNIPIETGKIIKH